ncbi:MAG: tetratricopeptide repeat protein [Cytophagales bacterium]|nr:tetratricopeptide repeat protein [Armatimonadota bacterium]
MNRKSVFVLCVVFTLGIAAGAFGKKGFDTSLYHSKDKREAARALLVVAKQQAGKGSWERIGVGRVYWEAGEWDKAKAAFEKSLAKNPNDDKGLAELGAYYLIKGDRAKAEELFDKSYSIEQGEVWNTAMIAGGYLGVKPQE